MQLLVTPKQPQKPKLHKTTPKTIVFSNFPHFTPATICNAPKPLQPHFFHVILPQTFHQRRQATLASLSLAQMQILTPGATLSPMFFHNLIFFCTTCLFYGTMGL